MNSPALNKTSLIAALLTAGAIGGAGVGAYNGLHTPALAALAPVASSAVTGTSLPDFPQITAQYGPAVVNISVVGTTKVSDDSASAQGDEEAFQGDPFQEFFRRFQQGQGQGQRPGNGRSSPQETPTRGQGSGFIVSSDGIILTNAHVVKGAKEVTVKLTDRREFRAKVLGSDPKTDVAVLRIDAKNLPVVSIGKTSDWHVDEW